MDAFMNTRNYVILIACVLAIGSGQILFKLSAQKMRSELAIWDLLRTPEFIAALVIYGIATLGWVSQLRKVNLSVAYPFMSLSFVVVPVASAILLREPIGARYWLGVALIVAGLAIGNGR
jgi:undecaprenyl phosphate-alpha-L-ara4N flippase subunit ArnE